MSVSLLSNKLYTPQRQSHAISRSRLTGTLLDGLPRPGAFALVSAPAGFGKTTLLSEFVSQLHQPAAWLSLDDGDNDPIRFWSYLIAACQTVAPSVGESALALLQSSTPVPEEAIPTILINDLVRLDRKVVLILDDYHVIHNASIHAALAFLLEHIPASLYLVLSTRVDPPWPLARLRVRQQLVEIRALDLRFSAGEAAAFLNQAMGLDLSAEDVAALETRTEGWIASLQLAALSMKGRSDASAFIRAFTGSHTYVAEYLVEEVLQRQPRDVREFLLRTSILERMNASLCEAVSGQPDGAARLKQVYQANLFVLPLDDRGEWFRYHQLFADLLRLRLHQDSTASFIAELQRRAMSWYEQAAMIPDAIGHALATPDYPHAVHLVEQVALLMIMQAYVRTVEGWLQAIPSQYTINTPRLDMAFAWLHLLHANPEQAQPYLDRLTAFFSAAGSTPQEPSLEGEWLAIQSKICLMQDNPARSRLLADRALKMLPESELHIRSMLFLNLATACEQLLEYDEATTIYHRIVDEARASGDATTEILGASAEARMLLQQGRLHAAFEAAREAVTRLETSGRTSPFSATLYSELGQINYYWHRLDDARSCLERSSRASGFSGYSDPEIYRHLIESRIHQMEGDWPAADHEMRQAAELARSIPPALVHEQIVCQQVRVDLALDRLPAAEAALQAQGFSFHPTFGHPALPPASKVTMPLALLYNSALRILLYRVRLGGPPEDLERGIALAALLLNASLHSSHVPAALETLLLRSQLRTALGDDEGGLEDVSQALELAEPEGFVSPFVEEGAPVASALRALSASPHASTAYIKRILECFPAMAPAAASPREASKPSDPMRALIEPLTPRELEVLQHIAAGDSNQAIADQLVITLSAVKKHTGNIFRKLSVNSRTQALVRARELGLLSSTFKR
ncbi:MAG TPA: LuxR C-terminal-related transcriptional regulator [Anaerolineales bacterium]